MPEQYQINDAVRHIHLITYLLAQADDKGKTHGEKHHIHEVMAMELKEVCKILHGDSHAIERNLNPEVPINIPF